MEKLLITDSVTYKFGDLLLIKKPTNLSLPRRYPIKEQPVNVLRFVALTGCFSFFLISNKKHIVFIILIDILPFL